MKKKIKPNFYVPKFPKAVKENKVVLDTSEYVAGLAHAQKLIIQLQDSVTRLGKIGITVSCKFKVDPFVNKLTKLIKVRSK